MRPATVGDQPNSWGAREGQESRVSLAVVVTLGSDPVPARAS